MNRQLLSAMTAVVLVGTLAACSNSSATAPSTTANPHDGVASELILTSDKRFPGHADLLTGIQQLDRSAVDCRKPVARRPDTRSAGHGSSGTRCVPPGMDGD